jgi:hypothetical protein
VLAPVAESTSNKAYEHHKNQNHRRRFFHIHSPLAYYKSDIMATVSVIDYSTSVLDGQAFSKNKKHPP